jgi:hypothetical protein
VKRTFDPTADETHHSKRAAPKHQSATKPNPGGVERHPDDVGG